MKLMGTGFFRQMLSRGSTRQMFVVAVLLLVYLSLRVAEYLSISYANNHFEAVLDTKCRSYLARAETGFSDEQRAARRIATELAMQPVVMDYLAETSQDQIELFRQVSRTARDQDVGVEVYDRNANLAAWDGPSGPVHKREVRIALDGQMISYVNHTPVSSQLFVATPVRTQNRIVGVVLVRRTIDVNYPLNNRYIQRGGLTEQLAQELGVTVEFNFSPGAEPKLDGRYLSTPLLGIDSSRVGVVSVLRPARSAFLESISAKFQIADAILCAMIVLLIAAMAWNILRSRTTNRVILGLAATLLIWGSRYGLLLWDVPASFLGWGIFDPANFASGFGYGIVKSIGDATITIGALAFNLAYVTTLLFAGPTPVLQRASSNVRVLRGATAVLTLGMFFWILRGYGAVLRGMVFDSSIRYSDPRVILSTFETGMMALNLFVLSSCIIVVGAGAVWLSLLLLSPDGVVPRRLNSTWVAVAGIMIAWAVLLGPMQASPLMSTMYRLAVGLGLVIGTLFLMVSRKQIASPRNVLIVLALSAALFYPLLDRYVHEKDRIRVEGFAQDVLRPVDGWFKFVVEDGLRTFEVPGTVDILQTGDEDETYRLAFTCWAQSLACREGYTSLFAITDTLGRDISRFIIGAQSAAAAEVDTALVLTRKRSIRVSEVGAGVNALKIYAGTIPLRSSDSVLLGYGRVVVAAGHQALFRGENPSILRSASQEALGSFYRPIFVTEFRDGAMLTTTHEALPVGYTLPERAASAFADSLVVMFWTEETVDGTGYETLYARREPGSTEIVALSMPKSGAAWLMAGIVRTFIQYAFIALIVLGGFFALAWFKKKRYILTFRDRLLVAFLITALVPLALVTLYGRFYARERLMDETSARLKNETASIGQNLEEMLTAGNRLAISPLGAEQMAADIGTDFNVYVENELKVSSRPELYEAGILDTRMSGSAYANVVMKGQRFFLETESIGVYKYAVGYRPIISTDGSIVGVVSVPTVYRQDQLDAEVSARSAFIFGVYILVLLAMIVVATVFANRIASPIQRLTEATRRVSRGELDVDVSVPHADAEIGELVHSFERMTRDLKRSREELIRYERELAWKEMAKQVAHEIKNPLTPMKLAIQYLRAMHKAKVENFPAVLDEVTQTVVTQIETLSRIASEFSHFARMPKPQLAPCDIAAVLDEAVRLFDQDTGVEFSMHADNNLPPIMADAEEIRRAFINIFRNSIQAMEGKGVIHVSAARVEESIRVEIRDSGPGISEEMRGKLFQPNFSTKTEGMGLGLAIVKKTVDDLGGTIDVSSRAGEGTTVTISFPIAAPTGT